MSFMSHYSILCQIFCAARKFRLTQKLAYKSWDLMWDLILVTVHVHIDKFQVLHRNDRTLNFLSNVHFVNDAHSVLDDCTKINLKTTWTNLSSLLCISALFLDYTEKKCLKMFHHNVLYLHFLSCWLKQGKAGKLTLTNNIID